MSLERLFFSENGNSEVQQEKNKHGKKFRSFVEYFNDSETFMIPRINGEPMPTQSSEWILGCSVWTFEFFNRPIIWYRGTYNGKPLHIKVTAPTDIDNKEQYTNMQLMQLACPTLTSEILQNKEIFKAVYERDIQLKDELIEDAVVLEYYTHTTVHFYYKDLYFRIELMSADEQVSDEYWSTFEYS